MLGWYFYYKYKGVERWCYVLAYELLMIMVGFRMAFTKDWVVGLIATMVLVIIFWAIVISHNDKKLPLKGLFGAYIRLNKRRWVICRKGLGVMLGSLRSK